jgi:hypothetical protein
MSKVSTNLIDFSSIFQAQKAQKVIQSFYSAPSATLTIQDGAEAGQTIKHVSSYFHKCSAMFYLHKQQDFFFFRELRLIS